MPQIALVGTSLLSSLVVKMLPQDVADAVVFFEEGGIGGAWDDTLIDSPRARGTV